MPALRQDLDTAQGGAPDRLPQSTLPLGELGQAAMIARPSIPTKTLSRYMPRIEARIDKTGGPDACWPWLGEMNNKGYGRVAIHQFGVRVRKVVHRVYFEALVGSLAPDVVIDHLCRNRCCMNLRHMEPVTSRENTLRGFSFAALEARLTHCPYGHPYNEANTGHWHPGKPSWRSCRECHRINHRGPVAKERRQQRLRSGAGMGNDVAPAPSGPRSTTGTAE